MVGQSLLNLAAPCRAAMPHQSGSHSQLRRAESGSITDPGPFHAALSRLHSLIILFQREDSRSSIRCRPLPLSRLLFPRLSWLMKSLPSSPQLHRNPVYRIIR